MTHPVFLREKARQLRVSKKLTIDELSERLLIPRTTIYYWVRDLPPIPGSNPVGRWPEGARAKGTRAMQRKYRLLRQTAYEDGRMEFASLALDPTFRDFVCLYVAEGYKRSRNCVAIGNSDPTVVRVANHWLKRFARNRLSYAIQYHADQDLCVLTRAWADELGIEPAAIRLQRKSNSNGLAARTWRSRYGVLTVSVGDTALRARLEGWMDCLRETWT